VVVFPSPYNFRYYAHAPNRRRIYVALVISPQLMRTMLDVE